MNRTDFLLALEKKLKPLPKDELYNVTQYYEDYFQDSNKSDEEVIKELGSPSSIASQILADYALRDDDNTKDKRKKNSLLMIILAIFAAPIGIPVAVTAVILLFVLILTIGIIFISFIAVAFALSISGILAFIAGGIVIFTDPSTACFYIGAGLFVLGISYIIAMGIKSITPGTVSCIKNLSLKILKKFKVIKEDKND